MDTRQLPALAALMLLTSALAGCATPGDATAEAPGSLAGTATYAGATSDASAATAAAPPATPLEGTYWKLTGLGNQRIETGANRPVPHLTLDAAQGRIAGSGGCNRFMGSYRLDGERLSFGGVAGTLMACMEGMEQERAFLSSLEHITTYRIAGKRLDLLNANGETMAQLEAGSPP